MHQMLLDHAQFVAEVTARSEGLVVDRVIRGYQSAKGKTFRGNLIPEPVSCCDRTPVPVVVGEKYWLLGPEREIDMRDARLLQHNDGRIDYLSHIRDLTPAQLRGALNRWKSGGFSPAEFVRFIGSVDVPDVESCTRGYYHRLLMDVMYMAWGNADHFQCDPTTAARVRTASASSALSVLSFIENQSRSGKLACETDVLSVKSLPDLVDRQVRTTEYLYPCIDTRNKTHLSAGESAVINAVLGAWFDEVHGANAWSPALLYYRTIRPESSQTKVRVFSPANEKPSRDYAAPGVRLLIEDLLARSTRIGEIEMPSHFQPTSIRTMGCEKPLAEVVTVSHPGIDNDRAIVYLEYTGGARAYYLTRENDRWLVSWYVELWQCG